MATFVLTVLFAFAGLALLTVSALVAASGHGGARPVVFAAAACFALAVWGVADLARAQTGAHGAGHAEQHSTYEKWTQPGSGASCCNDSDCRPTRAYLGDDGLWRAWDGWRWLTVPRDKVLPTDHAKDGRNHVCEMNGTIYCFTPAQPRG